MSGSQFITQTSKFLLINATAMTLGQGQGKVIQYISPDPYILCAKYQTVLTWEGKVFAAVDAADADAAETNWKHKVTPDRGDLIINTPYKLNFICTVEPLYNTIVFHQNTHKRHPIARP